MAKDVSGLGSTHLSATSYLLIHHHGLMDQPKAFANWDKAAILYTLVSKPTLVNKPTMQHTSMNTWTKVQNKFSRGSFNCLYTRKESYVSGGASG